MRQIHSRFIADLSVLHRYFGEISAIRRYSWKSLIGIECRFGRPISDIRYFGEISRINSDISIHGRDYLKYVLKTIWTVLNLFLNLIITFSIIKFIIFRSEFVSLLFKWKINCFAFLYLNEDRGGPGLVEQRKSCKTKGQAWIPRRPMTGIGGPWTSERGFEIPSSAAASP